MARHKADAATITALLAELEKLTAFSADLITDIDAVKNVVSGSWSGEANANFEALHTEWASGATDMKEGAHEIKARATKADTHYAAVAEHVKGVWG